MSQFVAFAQEKPKKEQRGKGGDAGHTHAFIDSAAVRVRVVGRHSLVRIKLTRNISSKEMRKLVTRLISRWLRT
jgi:hypothetical protein